MASGEKGIGWAMHCIQGGGKVRRPGWHEKAFITITGTPMSTRPHIMMSVGEEIVSWRPEQVDLLARDWEAVA